jgi:hypothetical protein
MSKRLFSRTGGANQNEQWEVRLQNIARNFSYPPTPDIASAVAKRLAVKPEPKPLVSPPRRLVWAALVALFILAGLLTVPQVRAAVVEFLQIGAIRIFLTEPTPTATSLPATPLPGSASTPRPSSTPLSSILDLAGETTLAEAQEKAGFPIRLPIHPPDLGAPNRVFFQNLDGPAVVLVWLEPDQPERVRLSLHQLGSSAFAQKTFAEKGGPQVIQATTVHGQQALWTEGPYVLQFLRNGRIDYDSRRLVTGHVLIWAEEEITYRLETDLPLTEAVRIAESLTAPTVTPGPTNVEPASTPVGAQPTARPSPTPLTSVLDLAGETTLAEAQEQTGFAIRWPAYPSDLGTPDRVFFQNIGGPAVVLVWLDPDQPERVRLSLHQLGPGTFADKGEPGSIQETTVHGQRALWTEGPYMLQFRRGDQVDYDMRRLVMGHVLLWVEGEITYRLETDLSLEEAVGVAESLR